MSKPRKFSAIRAIRQRDGVEKDLPRVFARLTDENLKEIERRSRMTAEPDGFGSGSSGEGVSNGEVSNPTERMALRLVSGEKVTGDVQMEAFRRIDNAFQACWDAVADIDAAWDLINRITDMKRGRETTLGTCQACLRSDVPNTPTDRIKAGYCNSCFVAWSRTDTGNGRQDRLSFELSRRELKVVDAS